MATEDAGTKAAAGGPGPKHTALVMSAGAPTAPLIAGILCRLYRDGYRFRTIYTSGGSALLGLMLVAPRLRIDGEEEKSKADRIAAKLELLSGPGGLDARLEGLERIADTLGVDDAIHRFLPVGYKAFHKASPFVNAFAGLAAPLKYDTDGAVRKAGGLDALKKRYDHWIETKVFAGTKDETQEEKEARELRLKRARRLRNDTIDLATAVLTPGGVMPGMRGLCTPLPFLEELVDFELLEAWTGEIYMPAYDLTMDTFKTKNGKREPQRRILQFTNKRGKLKDDERLLAGPAEFRACFSFPFIYPPASLDQQGARHAFLEGAAQDPINQEGWLDEIVERPPGDEEGAPVERGQRIDRVLIIDTLGAKKMEKHLLREPKGLWDAYGLSIVTAIVGSARARNADLKWELDYYHENPAHKDEMERTRVLWTDLIEDYLRDDDLPDDIWAWKHSNLDRMLNSGTELAQRFLAGERPEEAREGEQRLTAEEMRGVRNGFGEGEEYRRPS
jgi:hypothetical protein